MLIVLPNSKSNRFRFRRFEIINEIITKIIMEKEDCRILDVGGTPSTGRRLGHAWIGSTST